MLVSVVRPTLLFVFCSVNIFFCAGHIRDDSSSTFAKKEKAQEEQYFRKEQQKAIGALKGQINEEIENHKKEIARHQEAIKRYEEKVKNLDKGSK